MTNIAFTAIPLAQERLRDAINSNIGMTVVQWLPFSSTTGDFDDAGWRDLGILDGEFTDDSTKVQYEPMPGSTGVKLGVLTTQENIEKTLTFLAASTKAKAMAYGQNSPTFTAPTTVNASTVDADPVAPTSTVLVLAAVTGLGTAFAVGDTVKIATGGANDYADTDYAQVRAVDTTAKTITITPPLNVLPADGAAVATVGNLALTKTAGSLADSIRLRVIKYNRDAQSAEVVAYPEFKVKDGKIMHGDGQSPARVELTGFVIPERNTSLGKYVLSRHKTIYKP